MNSQEEKDREAFEIHNYLWAMRDGIIEDVRETDDYKKRLQDFIDGFNLCKKEIEELKKDLREYEIFKNKVCGYAGSLHHDLERFTDFYGDDYKISIAKLSDLRSIKRLCDEIQERKGLK